MYHVCYMCIVLQYIVLKYICGSWGFSEYRSWLTYKKSIMIDPIRNRFAPWSPAVSVMRPTKLRALTSESSRRSQCRVMTRQVQQHCTRLFLHCRIMLQLYNNCVHGWRVGMRGWIHVSLRCVPRFQSESWRGPGIQRKKKSIWWLWSKIQRGM